MDLGRTGSGSDADCHFEVMGFFCHISSLYSKVKLYHEMGICVTNIIILNKLGMMAG